MRFSCRSVSRQVVRKVSSSQKASISTKNKPTTTFSPSEDSEFNQFARKDDPSTYQSFLQEKARSVLLRRAGAMSESSMTSAEKNVFDDILKLSSSNNATTPAPQTHDLDETSVDPEHIVNMFSSYLPHTTNEVGQGQSFSVEGTSTNDDTATQINTVSRFTNSRSRTGDIDSIQTSSFVASNNIKDVALNIVKDISMALESVVRSNTSKQDIALWELCESKIFPLVKLITPQNTGLKASTERNTGNTATKADKSSNLDSGSGTSLAVSTTPKLSPATHIPEPLQSHPLISEDTPLIPLLSVVYPAALLLTLRLYRTHAPASLYARALLPHIKSLGPTSYVLGANTHFYNALLAIEWDIYSDLNTIIDLLTEMDRMGVGFDAGTMSVLSRISRERKFDLKGESYERQNFSATHFRNENQEQNADFTIATAEERKTTRSAQWWSRPLVHKSWMRFEEMKRMVSRKLAEKGVGEVMREGDLFEFE